MNVYRREMRANLKSAVFWCLGILLLMAGSMGKYSAMIESGQSMNALLEQLPVSIQAIMGVGYLDLTTISGFYAVLYLYIILLAAIHASMLGSGIISKEERDRTSEFLFVKPVTRQGVVTSKLIAALTNVLMLNLFTLAVSTLLIRRYGGGENLYGGLAKLMLGLFLLQLIFLALGAASAAVLSRHRAAAGVSAGVMLGTFMLSVAIDINEDLQPLSILTPFRYFEARRLLFGESLSAVHLAVSAGLIAALTAAAYVFFKRRDLRV